METKTLPTVFISFSEADQEAKDRLVGQLRSWQSSKEFKLCSKDDIGAGEDIATKLNEMITQADIAILGITADFLNSDDISYNIVPSLLERQEQAGLVIIPVIVKPCGWKVHDWLNQIQHLPKGSKPISSLADHDADEAYNTIANEIVRSLGKIAKDPPPNIGPETGLMQSLDEETWKILLERIKDGKCTPIIGPDLCQGVIKSGGEIAEKLAKEHNYPFDDVRNLPRVAQFLATIHDRAFLRDKVVELSQVNAQPDFDNLDEPHAFLASLRLPIYITTNYNDLMFQALKYGNSNANQILCRWREDLGDIQSVPDPESKAKVNRENPVVYHLFGDIQQPESLVLTKDDHLDFSIYTHKTQSFMPIQIEKAIVKTSLLFIGCSFSDLKFQVLFRGIAPQLESRLHKSVAVHLIPDLLNNEGTSAEHIQRYWARYMDREANIQIHWDNSLTFIKELRRRWEAFNYRD